MSRHGGSAHGLPMASVELVRPPVEVDAIHVTSAAGKAVGDDSITNSEREVLLRWKAHADTPLPTLGQIWDGIDPLRDLRGQGWHVNMNRLLELVFPCIWWIRDYSWRNDLRNDLIAGITVALILVPQGMGYAVVAGLQPYVGLYASFTPLYIYGIFGTSRQLSVGPVAICSLLTLNGMKPLVDPKNVVIYAQYCVMAMALMGLLQVTMGVFRLGWVVAFLSTPTLEGFTGGAAVTIILGQLPSLLGYKPNPIPYINGTIEPINAYFSNIEKSSGITAGLGIMYLVVLIALKELGKWKKNLALLKLGGPFVVLVLATGITYGARLDLQGIKIVGPVPAGFPPLSVPWAQSAQFASIFPTAVVLAIVGFLESISIDRSLSFRSGFKKADPSQELIALGLSNVFGSCFSAYPVTGSFSRSSVKSEIGARTQVAGLIVATIILVILKTLTFLLTYIPFNAFAAIIISALLNLIDFANIKHLWLVSKTDFALWAITFLGCIFLGVELGIAISVGLSLLVLVYNTARPHTAVLGRLPGSKVYRSVFQYPEASTHPGILVMRIDAPLFFANATYVKDMLEVYEESERKREGARWLPLRYVVLDMTPVSYCDITGVGELESLINMYKKRGVQVVLGNPNGNVLAILERAGIPKLLGADFIFVRMGEAMDMVLREMGRGEDSSSAGIAPQADVESGADATRARRMGLNSLSKVSPGTAGGEA